MKKGVFCELTTDEAMSIDGGGTLGNCLILAGGICLAIAGGPVGIGVGVFAAFLTFSDAQAW